MIALLGRRDEPTDGLRDYCNHLGEALGRRGVVLEQWELSWQKEGWDRALATLWKEAANWRGKWVVMQYTALSWSSRGLPTKVPQILRNLQASGARCSVVFHDANPFQGVRLRDRIRTRLQIRCMRRAYDLAEASIFPIPLEKVPWLPVLPSKATFVPIGANLPACSLLHDAEHLGFAPAKRIVIFGVTGHDIVHEVSQIQSVVNQAGQKIPGLELIVLGRGSVEAQNALERAFPGGDVKLSILGVLPEQELARHLAKADVLLFVRGALSLRRGTILAAMSCGLPIVGYEGPETDGLIREAGVDVAREGDMDGLATALIRVLLDDELRLRLRECSKRAYATHFAWDTVAGQFIGALSNA